jgi:hypothetical protein
VEAKEKTKETSFMKTNSPASAPTKLINPFIVGADPEFAVIDPTLPGRSKIVNVGQKFNPEGREFGWDHGGSVVELRPDPSRDIYQLTKKIRKLLTTHQNAKVIEPFKWKAGAYYDGQCLGGHIHFDTPFVAAAKEWDRLCDCSDCMAAQEAPKGTYESEVKVLDLLTQTLENLDILPKEESEKRRRGGDGYGRFGAVRAEGKGTEYRTMCSWLLSPQTTFTVLTASKLACIKGVEKLKLLKGKEWKDLLSFFEAFSGADSNVERFLARIAPRGLKYLQVDPDEDFKGSWREELEF